MPPKYATGPQQAASCSQYPLDPLEQPDGQRTPYNFPETRPNNSVPPSTPFAYVYGVGGPSHFKNTGRSGFTPLALPDDPDYPLSMDSTKQFYASEIFQRAHLHYSSLELHNLGALDKQPVKPNNLTNELHPIFEKEHWLQQGTVPVNIPGIDGFYDVNNPHVWDALLPCLRLSTMFLTNSHWWAWWDALIYGERRIMPVPPRNPFYPVEVETFHLRPVEQMVSAARTGAVKRFMKKLSENSHYFQIETGDTRAPNPTTGFVPLVNNQGSNSMIDPQRGLTTTTITWQNIEPLLRTGLGALSDSQRLMQQFQIAKTMVHELCHQIGRAVESEYTGYEPHFEDETVAELGRSMEKAIFGYITYGISPPWENTQTRPIITHLFATWPTHRDHIRNPRRGATLNPPELRPGSAVEWWALPISYYESMQQAEFWTHFVARWGSTAIHPYPKLHGMKHQFVAEDEEEIYSEMIGVDFDTFRNVSMGMRDLEAEVWAEHNGNGTARERVWRRERIREARYRAAVVQRSKRLDGKWKQAILQAKAVYFAANRPPQMPVGLDPALIDPALR